MRKEIENLIGIDRFDPDLEVDYDQLTEALVESWKSATWKDKISMISIIDDMAAMGRIRDPRLASILAESYSANDVRYEADEELAQMWALAANGDFKSLYNLIPEDVLGKNIKRMVTFHLLIGYVDARSMRVLPALLNLYGRALTDLGGTNEGIFYATEAIAWAQRCQEPEVIGRYPVEVQRLFFDEEHLTEMRLAEAEAWYERGRACRLKFKESDDVSSYRGKSITAMKRSASLGNENATYYFPSLLTKGGTNDAQLSEAAAFAKDLVLSNPDDYITTGDAIGEETNDEDVGLDVVCLIAQCYAEGLYSFPKDGRRSRELFEIAAKHDSDWAKEALSCFKKKIIGGWEYVPPNC